MKRKIFNPSLYLDSLRRTALLGGLFTALLCIQSAIMFFGFRISYTFYTTEEIGHSIETMSLLEMNPCILTIPFLLIPLVMLTLFSFMNNRSTSDFWHSTPFSRECLYTTFTVTALTWAVTAAILSTVTSITLFSFSPYYAVSFETVFSTTLSALAMSLLVAGVLAIASSITGTMLNTIITSAIILFLPRVIMLYFSSLISNGTLFNELPHQGFGSLSLNLIFGLISGVLFGGTTILELLSDYTSIGYTALLGIVYLGIGLVLFKHRKSETASQSSVNKYLQAAIRIIVAFIVCLIPIFIITENYKTKEHMDAEQIFLCFVLYIVATVVYLLYELITTKKAKNMLKALPALPILVVANIIMIIAINQTYKAEYNYTPTPQSVSAIRFSAANIGNTEDYFEKMKSMTDINDSELESFLCDAYAKTRDAYESETLYQSFSDNFSVGFKEGNRYKYRQVFMTKEDYEKFYALIDKNEQLKRIYNVDTVFEKAILKDFSVNFFNEIEYTKEEQNEIMNTYIKDAKALPFNEWYTMASRPYDHEIITSENKENYYNYIGDIYLSINVKGKTYYANLPIDSRLENTYNLIMKKIFKYQEENNTQQLMLDAINSEDLYNKENYKDIYVELYNGKTLAAPEGYSLANKYLAESFVKAITPALNQVPDANSRIANISYYIETEGEGGRYWYHEIECLFKVPDDADLSFFIEKLD